MFSMATYPIIERWNSIENIIERYHPSKSPRTILVAVSKAQPKEAIVPLLNAGQRDFGENRLQEALIKWPELKVAYVGVRLHLIGSLQTNKVKEALTLFDVFHTVDRAGLVDALAKYKELWKGKQFFVQVNTGGENQKGGVLPVHLPALLHYCHEASLPVSGLMCIPPIDDNPAPHFAFLRMLGEEHHLPFLSMGMSDDYETALRLGATHVRIGTALFGKREAT